MYETLYSTLLKCIDKSDPDVMRIFTKTSDNIGFLINERTFSNANLQFAFSQITNAKSAAERRRLFDTLISPYGCELLLKCVMTKGNFADSFISEHGDAAQIILGGCPRYRVEFERKELSESKSEGYLNIYLVSTTDESDKRLLLFPRRESKMIYFFFLLHSGEEIENIYDFGNEMSACWQFLYNEKRDIRPKHIENFLSTAKTAANAHIINVINSDDTDKWYIIDFDKSSRKYSLSLPSKYIKFPKPRKASFFDDTEETINIKGEDYIKDIFSVFWKEFTN